ncbi:MAG: zinc-binding alcohol dehydrogenase family protein [Acidobacteriota bacterium]
MKAIQISETGGPEVLDYVELETPTPGAGQVLVRTESISINFADVLIRRGLYPMMPPLPAVPGFEASGVVEVIGDAVTPVEVGQRVSFMGNGCYAEYVLVDAAALIPIPDVLDSDTAAAFPINYLTAYHMMHTMAKLEEGQSILSYAAVGGVGIAVIQLAKLAGFKVIGLTSSDEKIARARELGIDHIVNYKTQNVVETVRELTRGKGVELILDSVAGPAFHNNFEMLAPLGQVIWYGLAAGPPPENLLRPLRTHFGKGVGVRTFHLFYSIAEPFPQLMAESIQTLVRYLVEKKVRPVIHDRIPLKEATQAHRLLESQKTVGKLILKP